MAKNKIDTDSFVLVALNETKLPIVAKVNVKEVVRAGDLIEKRYIMVALRDANFCGDEDRTVAEIPVDEQGLGEISCSRIMLNFGNQAQFMDRYLAEIKLIKSRSGGSGFSWLQIYQLAYLIKDGLSYDDALLELNKFYKRALAPDE